VLVWQKIIIFLKEVEIIVAIILMIISVGVFGPLAYIAKKFVLALNLEGPLRSDVTTDALTP